ncbi:MAG: alpha/beta hydrolase family protein [Phycisphaerae bacterium]
MLALAGLPLAFTACVPPLPQNIGNDALAQRELDSTFGAARAFREAGVADALWLEIDRSAARGAVGGYFARAIRAELNAARRADIRARNPANASDTTELARPPGLVVLLAGASTFYDRGPIAKALDYHRDVGALLRAAGFDTWFLVVRECGTPYGGGDLADLLDALDWLEIEGRAALDVERVYLVGYSSGATPALLASLDRRLDAVVAIDGLTRADLFEQYWLFDNLVANLYPENTGICQFRATLHTYGLPGSPAYAALDVVGRIDRLKSPLLVIHGRQDVIYPYADFVALRDAYERAARSAAALPSAEFVTIPDAEHIQIFERNDVRSRVIDYLLQH